MCEVSTATGWNDSGRVDQVHGLRQRFDGEHAMPSTTAASRALASGTTTLLDAAFARRQAPPKARRARSARCRRAKVRREKRSESSSLPKNVPWQPRIAERHGQIERRAFLADVGGRQIDRDGLRRRIIEAAIAQRGLDALAAFVHGIVRQAHDVEIARLAGPDVHLDLDEVGVDSKHGGADTF